MAGYARRLLQFEGYSNMLVFGPLLMAFPGATLQQFFPPDAAPVDELACEVWRWFGALTVAISYCLVKAVALPASPAEEIVLKGFLIGDVLYVGATAHWAHRTQNREISVICNIVYGVVLLLGRLVVLGSYGTREEKKKG